MVTGDKYPTSAPRPSLDEEARLIRLAQTGDSEAFAVLYQAYVQAVHRFVLLRVGDGTLAEDMTADIFMRAIDGLPRYSHRGLPFGAWLFRIARDRVVDYYRQSARRPTANLDDSLASELPGPSLLAESAEMTVALRMALEQLTDEQRDVIQLRFMEDWSLEETAQVMNKSANAIKALQHRALNTLNRLMNGNRKKS